MTFIFLCYSYNGDDSMRLLLLLSVLPSYLLGKYVYQNDKVEKEPKNLLITLFIFGVISIIITLVITFVMKLLIPFFAEEPSGALNIFIYYFIGVGLIEEFSKWIMLYIGTWNNNNFDYQYDGLIYAVFVSLGFATLENIMYVLGQQNFIVAILRALVSVPGHAFFGVFMGYYYGLAKKDARKNKIFSKNTNLLLSILIPTVLHGLFDSLLTISANAGSDLLIPILLLYVVFVVILYIYSFNKIKKMSEIRTNIDDILTREIPIVEDNSNNKVYCSECGNIVNSRYCPWCGTRTIIK